VTLSITPFVIEGPLLVAPERFCDKRGFFSETYNARAMAAVGIELSFVQDNYSMSIERGTVRGFHAQSPPNAQAKLVSVVRGRILDVFIDIRRNARTYGQHCAIELSADNWLQVLIPIGFAHGFCTLESGTEVVYKTSNYYVPEAECGFRWNDPALGIAWPEFAGANVSPRDSEWPAFAQFESPFAALR
jgi:dTDP-4-dehydrorhamnose 3,5-epimerase